MKKNVYTREQIELVYEEVMRRARSDAELGAFSTYSEINDFKCNLCQGVYSFLLATAANYPDCIQWCIEIEDRIFTDY